jgi:hypothetical protein
MRRSAALLACTATLALAQGTGRAQTPPIAGEPAPMARPQPVILEIRPARLGAGYIGATGSLRKDVMFQATIGLELGVRLGESKFYGRGALDTGAASTGSVTEGRIGVELRTCGQVMAACFFLGSDTGLLRYSTSIAPDDNEYRPYDFGADGDTTALLLEPRAGIEILGDRFSLRFTATERIVRLTESDATWYGGGLNGTIAVRW